MQMHTHRDFWNGPSGPTECASKNKSPKVAFESCEWPIYPCESMFYFVWRGLNECGFRIANLAILSMRALFDVFICNTLLYT